MAAAARSGHNAQRRISCRVDGLHNTLRTEDKVAAIVPKLMVRGTILSPAEPFLDFIRHQFRNYVQTLDQAAGIQLGRVSAYNSGSALSVPGCDPSAVFLEEFWLDYLDHAVFHALWSSGRRVYVLQAVLQHELAESDLNARPIWRFRNVLQAQSLFVKRTEASPTGCSTGYGCCGPSGACGPICRISAFGKRRRGKHCFSTPPAPPGTLKRDCEMLTRRLAKTKHLLEPKDLRRLSERSTTACGCGCG